MSDRIKRALFILMRLYHNQAGNTLAIVAAAIFPLAAMIGGGVDMSRLYITKTRLQQACDAGALAGRRAMTGLTWTTDGDTSSRSIAEKFFNINFPANKYGTSSAGVAYSASSTGAVTGNASVVVPMTLMSLFNMPSKTLTASCTADLQLPNTDVMFVLDTTGSMSLPIAGETQSKIEVLRNAVTSFYNELEHVRPAGSHIRYGFVPYSNTVNVGMLLKRDWIVDIGRYDSRVPDGYSEKPNNPAADTVTSYDPWQKISGSSSSSKYQGDPENCVAPPNEGYSDTSTYTAWSPSGTAVPRSQTRTRTRKGTTYSPAITNNICWITKTVFVDLVETQVIWVKANPNAGQSGGMSYYYHWIYRPVDYPMTDLKGAGDGNSTVSGGTIYAPVSDNYAQNDRVPNSVAKRTIRWNQTNACIEERATRRTDEGNSQPRYDMDIDLIPAKNNAATQWKPYLPGLVYGRKQTNKNATTGWLFSEDPETRTRDVNLYQNINYVTPNGDPTFGGCPTYARKLAEIDGTTLATYLNGLQPTGLTYHDIGMLWGLRLISREGLFAAEHAAAESTGRYARNLIFMTDGDTETRIGAYDAWGMSAVQRRRTPKSSIPTDVQQDNITETRLAELCTIAKNQKNITVWVIAFGTTLTQMLSDCASPGRAYQADSADQLTATFSQIASQIAQLRVTR